MARPSWMVCCFVVLALMGNPISASLRQPAQTETVDAELRAYLKQTIDQADSFDDRFDAEVWLMDMSTRMRPYLPDERERLTFLRHVHSEARQAGLKPDLVIALIHVESLFDRFALSRVGAQGVMQVMPFWKHELGRPEDNLIDLQTNLRYGCTILKFYLEKERGNLRRALARYNGSLGSQVYPDKVFEYWHRYWYVRD